MFKKFYLKNKYRMPILRNYIEKSYEKFTYSRNMPVKKRPKNYTRFYISRLHDLLRFRLYYGDMTIKKFRKYLQQINVRRIDFESKICFLLESRLDILLYRLNLVKNPKEARQYIKCKKIKINGKIVNKLNFQIYINDVITFDSSVSKLFKKTLSILIANEKLLFNYPKYVEMNYNLMKCIFIKYPIRKTIPTT